MRAMLFAATNRINRAHATLLHVMLLQERAMPAMFLPFRRKPRIGQNLRLEAAERAGILGATPRVWGRIGVSVPKRTAAIAILLTFACACTSSGGKHVAGFLLAHQSEGDAFVTCDWRETYFVDPNDPVTQEARVLSLQHTPPSAYIEAIVRPVSVPEDLRFIPYNGAYRFVKIKVAKPYPGGCPPVERPPSNG